MATIILKVTEECNSQCVYCDIAHSGKIKQTMSLEMIELVFKRINEYLLLMPNEEIAFTWHGGEPLLLGADYFEEVCNIQDDVCRQTKGRIKHLLQSNLTLFDESFIPPFSRLGITTIGSSYQPEPGLRGSQNGSEYELYNRKFMKSTSILDKHEISWGLIYVVTKASLSDPLKKFLFLTNLKLSGAIMINPVIVYDDIRKHIAITPDEYVDFLGAIFPFWWQHSERFPAINPFSELTGIIRDKRKGLCCGDSGNCSNDYMSITPDGETSHCGRSADWKLLSYGNIKNRSMSDILNDIQRIQFQNRIEFLQETECKDCRFWLICHGGCPLDSLSRDRGMMHKSEWCEAKKGFIEKYFEPVTGLRFNPDEYSC